MISTAAVLSALQEIQTMPLGTGGLDLRNPAERVGPYDLIAPVRGPDFPCWRVAVYHDARLMEQRRRYDGSVDERGLSWFLDGDEFTSDDQLIYWHAWKIYGNVELHWYARVERETTPELIALDQVLSRLSRNPPP